MVIFNVQSWSMQKTRNNNKIAKKLFCDYDKTKNLYYLTCLTLHLYQV